MSACTAEGGFLRVAPQPSAPAAAANVARSIASEAAQKRTRARPLTRFSLTSVRRRAGGPPSAIRSRFLLFLALIMARDDIISRLWGMLAPEPFAANL